jgi:hypothetical protein
MVPIYSYLSRKFDMIHEHNLRGSGHNSKTLNWILKEKLYYRGATLWNDIRIPIELARAQSLAEFKSKIS